MRTRIITSVIGILVISLGLAWISTEFQSLQGWFSFFAVTSLGVIILMAGWWVIWSDQEIQYNTTTNSQSKITDSHRSKDLQVFLPKWLVWLLIGAAVLRLGAGVLWFLSLPTLGYGSDIEKSGYVMSDAFNRDMAAWDLAQSEKSLLTAFSEFHNADQYGGMLYGSALIYRYLGGIEHQPLQIVVLTAVISTLAVLFTWAFARRTWDSAVAGFAGWIVALFPDAVLLGSSQMREAILMSLVVMSFYGLVRFWQDRTLKSGILMVAPILISLPLSPLFGLMLAGMLGFYALYLSGGSWLKDWRVWVVLVGIIGIAMVVVTVFGEQILPGGAPDPMTLLQRWMKQAGRWQAYYTEHASGWMQKIFRSSPVWTHSWLLVGYGVARPFLPAALFDPAAAIWQGIAIWRSLGWTLLLPFLFIAPITGWRRSGWRSRVVGLCILVWVGIVLSSYRGGGDHWDNPRYRVIWIGLQASLAAWVWVTQRRDESPWLRRVLVGMGLILIWWVPWYLRRITALPWPFQDVFLTLGLGVISALIYLSFDIWFERRRTAKKSGE